jgi:uncharacterized Zn-finger protein
LYDFFIFEHAATLNNPRRQFSPARVLETREVSKSETQTKLQLPHGPSTRDLSKRAVADRAVWRVQVHHVKCVGGIRANLHPKSFTEFEFAENGQVHGSEAGLVQQVARCIPVNRRASDCGIAGECIDVEPFKGALA